jgi:hypothetical protein
MADHVETTRWVQFSPQYDTAGKVRGMDALITKGRPRDVKGPTIKVTFRLPKRVFEPLAEALVEIADDMVDGSAEVILADLKEMRRGL